MVASRRAACLAAVRGDFHRGKDRAGSLPQALFISFPPVLGDTGKVKTVPSGKEVGGPETV